MRDVYLWTGLAIGSFVVGCGIVALYRRAADWLDRRAYVPPTTVHTEVWPEMQPEPAPVAIPAPIATPVADVSGWALDALADARKASEDTYATLGEFARPVATASAPIWAEIYGRRHVQGLAIA